MKTILTLFVLCAAIIGSFAIEIRVRNGTDVDFKDVIVGGKKYGDIKRGAVTDYQTWKEAYRYSSVSLTATNKPLRIQPIDYVGETPLADGNYTYVLGFNQGYLQIRAEKDVKK
jgi:hypothetical protein